MPPMMNDSMAGGMMTVCMIASTLFALVILICVVIQTVVQVKILGEIRSHATTKPTDRKDANRP
jgi:uncharacterized membrane protein